MNEKAHHFATPNLRKAAVLIRSLDAETAAGMLAQLSADEAAAIRDAVRALGAVDPEEQADVVAELRRTQPRAEKNASAGVELELSSSTDPGESAPRDGNTSADRRFEFLDQAPTESLGPYLAREHAQTVAVVLAHLPPARAAAVLAALPPKLQAATIDRLTYLGDYDPESIAVLERELAAWVARQPASRRAAACCGKTIQGIIAAADASTRTQILANLQRHNNHLAAQIAPALAETANHNSPPAAPEPRTRVPATAQPPRSRSDVVRAPRELGSVTSRQPPPLPPEPALRFEDLTRLGAAEVAVLLREVDANVWVLALAGASEELIEHLTREMPRRAAKALRRKLRQLGPTRLSDVEVAQRAVARAAANRMTHLPVPQIAMDYSGDEIARPSWPG